MALPVNLQAVVEEMDMAGNELTAYIHRKTGKLVTLSDEYVSYTEGEDDDGFAPDWQKEMVAEAKEVLSDQDYLALPDQFAINEYSIMERFCITVDDERVQDALLRAISGKGAFRRFKDRLFEEGSVRDDWFAYRDRALKKIAADFLESRGIPFVDE